MTLMVTRMGASGVAMSQGVSPEAELVMTAQRRNQEHLTSSATFSKREAYDSLVSTWTDCREGDWDGYGAAPVERATLDHARRFIDALPLGVPLPSVGVEPDGHVTLEWYRDPKWTLSVSVSPESRLSYSALFDSDDPRGSSTFVDEVPRTILHFIEQVQQG